jgi:hypothetical protein
MKYYLKKDCKNILLVPINNVVHRLQTRLKGTFGALGSCSMVFVLRLRLKAQPIEPVYKISFESPVIQFFAIIS